MGRIRDAYELKFRELLRRVRPRRLELGVQLLLERAERLSERQGVALPEALEQVYRRAREQVDRREWRESNASECAAGRDATQAAHVFVCDAGLGGLARWLRAAGYEAYWDAAIDDDDLIREARRIAATLLTTDSLLMERGVLRDGWIPALWVPPSLRKLDQLAYVFRELRLVLREPRCMSCGGELRRGDKESLRERIPPKTYLWRDEYFVCARCDKLYWRGSHWDRIGDSLRRLGVAVAARSEG